MQISCINFTPNSPQPFPDSKVHGANMGPIWGQQDPGGSHVGPMNLAIWVVFVNDDVTIPANSMTSQMHSC